MKKLLITFVLLFVSVVLCACGATPCEHIDADGNSLCDKCNEPYDAEPGEDGDHTHAFTVESTENNYLAAAANCSSAATYYYSCACGEAATTTFKSGEALQHTPAEAVEESRIEATCSENGSYESVVYCSVCQSELSRESVQIPAAHSYVGTACTACGIQYIRDGEYIYFGEYPQSVARNVTIDSKTIDNRGYYLGSDGAYYAKVVATPYESGYAFSMGAEIKSGTGYYFKVEPIRWRILSEEGGTALIICDSIIERVTYDSSNDNDYKDSEVRAWLLNEFYNNSFTALQKEIILITTVDNSADTTCNTNNQHACENTEDAVFLISYSDVLNQSYGFSESVSADLARVISTSDYSRALGVQITQKDNTKADYGCGSWWLRSPHNNNANCASYVYGNGAVSTALYVNTEKLGVVPAMWIKL